MKYFRSPGDPNQAVFYKDMGDWYKVASMGSHSIYRQPKSCLDLKGKGKLPPQYLECSESDFEKVIAYCKMKLEI